MCAEIEMKGSDDGCIPYGIVANTIRAYKDILPWQTRDMINKCLRK